MQSIERKILSLKVKTLYSSLSEVTIGALLLPTLVCFSLREDKYIYWLLFYTIGAILLVGRNWFLKKEFSDEMKVTELKRYVQGWSLQTYFFALLWAVLPWLESAEGEHSILIIGFVIAGVTAGTTISCVPFPKISLIYSGLVLSSLTFNLLYRAHDGFYGMALTVFLYFILVVKMQKTMFSFFLKTFLSMIELDEANERIQKSQTAAVLSSRLAAQAEMTANFAHEINNPLAVIHLKVEHLLRCIKKESLTDEVVKDACEKSIKMIDRMQEIISSTKKYFYHEQEEQFLSEVELKDLLDEVSDVFSEKCLNRGVSFEKQGMGDVKVRGARTANLQVITNLLNNSFDAVKNQSCAQIKLLVEEQEDFVLISTVDSGEGVSPRVREKIFEPFYTTKGKGAGLGIGLSICLSLAKEMGAELWLERGSPTTFRLKLNCINEKSKAA